MKTSLHLNLLALCFLTATAAAQETGAPVSDALRSAAKSAGTNLVAAAEVMPAGKYSFKPTPAQMSFGDVIAHLSGGNDFLCSRIAGVEASKKPEITGKAPKAQLVTALKESFQSCDAQLAKVDDSKLSEKIPFSVAARSPGRSSCSRRRRTGPITTASSPTISVSISCCRQRRSRRSKRSLVASRESTVASRERREGRRRHPKGRQAGGGRSSMAPLCPIGSENQLSSGPREPHGS